MPRTLFPTGALPCIPQVVRDYEDAIAKPGYRLYWGPSAATQAPDLGDVPLHETAVSWSRTKTRATKPDALPSEETQEQWAARACKVVRDINANLDVRGLRLEFPSRLQDVVDNEGDRLCK